MAASNTQGTMYPILTHLILILDAIDDSSSHMNTIASFWIMFRLILEKTCKQNTEQDKAIYEACVTYATSFEMFRVPIGCINYKTLQSPITKKDNYACTELKVLRSALEPYETCYAVRNFWRLVIDEFMDEEDLIQ